MRFWSDLSFREKRAIEEGDVNPHKYLNNHSYLVKKRVAEGQKKRRKKRKK